MLKNLASDSSRRALDVVNILAGIALALSPWLLGYAADAVAVWHVFIAGVITVLIAARALVAFHKYEEWANLVVGLWIVAASWVLGFAGLAAAMWSHAIAGAVVAALAAASLWLTNDRPLSAA
ncbi:SPW repeat protein [Mesorhizobium sp. WSM1293]|uniref:SPW repeat domain-containing protein n=1 Tax=Mesorhizobium sp. WSM1293 TaxID=1040984 RepID=UPI00047F7632|nr:SPW repeat protein [Mesorhizobium sp. WSM1293]